MNHGSPLFPTLYIYTYTHIYIYVYIQLCYKCTKESFFQIPNFWPKTEKVSKEKRGVIIDQIAMCCISIRRFNAIVSQLKISLF